MKIKNIWGNLLFAMLIVTFLFVPQAKALVINGLMQVGLFSPDVAVTTPVAPPIRLSDIKFKDRNGRIVSLQQFHGKVVFINIWATWCPPCLAELPSINKLYQRYQSDINTAFLLVDADGDLKKSGSLFSRKGYMMPLYAMYTELPASLLGNSIPTTLVFDKKGNLAFRQEGAANYNSEKFLKFMESLKSK